MATQEKLLKSLEVLKTVSAPNQTFDPSKSKDKIQHCHIVTEAISNSTIKIAPNFHTYLSITLEVLLQLCDDQEANVRMKAEECLNRIIRALSDGNIGKVQIELHKGIKRNGSVRSLRAALWRFAQLAHLIRPHKGKPYVVNLFPTLIKVSERPEEQIHETLANSLAKIIKVLGCFSSDTEIKGLLKGFLKNVSNSSAAIRRAAATSILNVCLNCRKPYIFIIYVINYLLDLLIPVSDNQNSSLTLGVMTCLKNILPHLQDNQKLEANVFDSHKSGETASIPLDKLLQIYEICLFYLSNKDHNIINGALETLNILLQTGPPELIQALTSKNGIEKSRINPTTSSSMSALRSPSQLSVATSGAAEDLFVENELTDTIRPDIEKWIDESKLSVMNITYAKMCDLEKSISVESKSSSADVSLSQVDSFKDTIHQYVPEAKSHSIEDNLESLTLSDNSSEKSFSYIEDDKHNGTSSFQEISIGSILDNDISLIYCARLITKSFLLSGHVGGTISDKSIRVSVKSLALSCLASIVKIYPKVLVLYLDKNCLNSKLLPKNLSHQQISDLILYENHSDPQLRGVVRTVLANFITTVLKETNSDYDSWITEHYKGDNMDTLQMANILNIFVNGLKDESSHCSRHIIMSLGLCLEKILESSSKSYITPILNYLPLLAMNSYWLVKVALCELVCKLPFVTIHHITGSSEFQDRIIHDVLFYLLEDKEPRVRSCAANSIITVIPFLYHQEFRVKEDTVTSRAVYYKDLYLSNLCDIQEERNLHRKHLVDNMPFPFNDILAKSCDKIEFSLSKIVSKLYSFLLTRTSQNFIFGCIETLSLLSNAYPTTVYKTAWNCYQISKLGDTSPVTLDLFNFCIYLLSHSVISYDLTCHLNLLNLSSNLYAGYSLCVLKPVSAAEPATKPWDMFISGRFAKLTEHYLNHMMKLLNILHYVVDEVIPNQPQSKAVLPHLSASPIKRRKSDLDKRIVSPIKLPDKEDKDSRPNTVATFVHLPHYLKIYDILRSAYTNYKITLESEASEKFSGLLKQTLKTFSVLMEVGTLVEFQGIAEEILSYLKFTFTLEASATVECVQQLLKCLFGNNLTSNISVFDAVITKKPNAEDSAIGFYYNLFQMPYNEVSKSFNLFNNIHKVECDGDSTVMGYLHRKDVTKAPFPLRSSDKILANYIRIFEPMVIKSLKHYTITSDVSLQCKVLQLLNQLIQLRVNYCLLDSEQIFIGFVLKQFEYIEEGQIPCVDELIRKIFQFLVQLSYSKQHSKSIITTPKIIQLCDGLMASGQSPSTHCIPALEPLVENIFLMRNKSNTADLKELETTRDVVLSMLLRLCEYHQVIDLIVLILDDSKYCSNAEKWSRWSTQVINVIVPLLKQNKIKLDSIEALVSLRKLVFVLEPSVFKPIDNVVLLLFQDSLTTENWQNYCTRKLGKVLISLLILSALKEDNLLLKINELKSDFAPGSIFDNCVPTADPLNVLNSADIFQDVPPEKIFVRFLFKVIALASKYCTTFADEFLAEELSILLMVCIYIFQSGSHCKIGIYAISNTNSSQLEEISKNFLTIFQTYPVLTFLWCYVLTLVNYNDESFWAEVTSSSQSSSLNKRVVSSGSIILYCDYMNQDVFKPDQLSWFFKNHVIPIIGFSREEPITEFISCVHRNSVTSKMFIDSLTKIRLNCSDPVLLLKILKCIENTHPDHTGSVLKLLLPDLLLSRELSVSRQVANLASRKIELLLTMRMEEVNAQLAKEDLLGIIKKLMQLNMVKKHEALASLLNKLCTQYYDITPLEFDQKRVNPDYIKKLQINKNWYLSQIKGKCNTKETAQLLTALTYEELIDFMKSEDFPKTLFKETIRLGLHDMERHKSETESPLVIASIECLLAEVAKICRRIPEPHQVYNVYRREPSFNEFDFFKKLTNLCGDADFFGLLYDLVPSVTCYIESLPDLPKMEMSDPNSEALTKFAVTCLETINYLVDTNFNVNYIDLAVKCSDLILRENKCLLCIESHISWFSSAVNSLYKLVDYLLSYSKPLPTIPKYGLNTSLEHTDTMYVGESCNQLYILVAWLYKIDNSSLNIPKFIFEPIKNIIISLSRLSIVNSYILTPAHVWERRWSPELFGNFYTQVPPLPIEFLQETDILKEFIFRINLLGWTSRQQFEETWMCLLSVLCNNTDNQDEAVVQVSSLTVKAITSLLVQTLYCPVPGHTNISKLIHVPRCTTTQNPNTSVEKLRKIHNTIEKKHAESTYLLKIMNVFKQPNFDKRFKHYSYSQVSIKYLMVATKSVVMQSDCHSSQIWEYKENLLEKSGLDINSCLQFLLDYYTQLLKHETTTPLRFLHEIVRSTVIISDLFTDKSQFSWMLEIFLELSKLHTVDDELLHQYLIIGISKAAAVLTPDLETYENIKKMLVHYLKSSFLPSRIASLHGLLYILEGCKLSNISIGGISDEMQIMLPCAVEYVQCNLNSNNGILKNSQEHTVLIWTLAFFIIENIEEIHLESSFITNTIHQAFTILLQQRPNNSIHTLLMKALERLIIFKKNLITNSGKQIMNLALEKTKSDNSFNSTLGMQLVLTYMYTDCTEQLEAFGSHTNPDHLVQTIEKISAIFEHIKRGHMFEVEILCHVLPDILNDFFAPADILTKVIGEFLSPQQPHPKLLSRVVFQVFERAIQEKQLPLLQDWVVFSLSNFTQSLSLSMATWCLTCFFISASTNPWLRLFFPYVQTRVGRYEYEDRKILCIAGSDFYANLTNDKQKATFVENFNKTKLRIKDTLFNDLLSSL